jgi:hypothetical protein
MSDRTSSRQPVNRALQLPHAAALLGEVARPVDQANGGWLDAAMP